MILLENQLPYFIVEKQYDKRYYPTFLQLIYNYFEHRYVPAVEAKPHPREVKHFTDLVRCSMLIEPSPRNLDFPIELKYNATTLLKAGVKFVVVDNNHLLDIRFDNGVLKIPRLVT